MVPASDVAALFDWAQRHALALFPIKAFCKQSPGKIVFSHSKDWSKDRAQWQRWYDSERGCNFGIECGPSGIDVVDVDVDKETWKPLFDERWADWANGASFCVETPSGGWHMVCRVPEGVDALTQTSKPIHYGEIDVRAGNAYVVAPWCETRVANDPQVKRDGFYRIVKDPGGFPWAPPDLVEHCARPSRTAPRPPVDGDLAPDGYPVEWSRRVNVEHRVKSLVAALQACPPKTRNRNLYKTAVRIGRLIAAGSVDRSIMEAMLCAEGRMIGQTSLETPRTVKSGLDAGIELGPDDERGAIDALLGAVVPTEPRAAPYDPMPATNDPESFPPPVVEWLVIEGCVTVLAGGSGSGKTTVVASLMASAAAGLKHFNSPEFGVTHSDVLARDAAWLCLSYEGGQFMDVHRRAWHLGMGAPEIHVERRRIINFDGPLVWTNEKRQVVFDMKQVAEIDRAIAGMRTLFPNLPLVLAIDNISAAVADQMDQAQAAEFMKAMRLLARRSLAILLLAHPPKGQGSTIYGSHLFFSFADIVAQLTAIYKTDKEWTQWVKFDKHRGGAMHRCLEFKSRRLDHPIADLPIDWGDGNPKARMRALQDLCIPYIYQIQAKNPSERDLAAAGGRKISEVTQKESNVVPITVPEGRPSYGGEGAVRLAWRPKEGSS